MQLILVCGLSFAGKTTLANAMCATFGFAQVDVDETKDELCGPGVPDATLSRAQWIAIYEETDARIVRCLQAGRTVVDASRNFRRDERDAARSIAAGAGAETVVVYVNTPEFIVRQRWTENRVTRARRNVSEAGFEEIIAAMEPPAADEQPLVFHHGDDIGRWLTEHADQLVERGRPAIPRNDS